MAKIPTMLCLDVEDPITMRSHRAAEWICRDIADAGVTASCFLVAEKVRAWEKLGLREVIDSVGLHDLCFHSTRHSFHPTITEISECLPAQQGAEMLWGWERPGWEAVERIMHRPVNHWGLSGCSWSPALSVMLAQHGHALHYSPIWRGDDCRPCWFAGGLNFRGGMGGLDAAYHDDGAFEKALAGFKRRIDERLEAGAVWLGLFCCHPTRVVHHAFWDGVNFGKGTVTVPEDMKGAPAITAEEEKTARRNLGRFLQWLSGDERFDIIGFSELVRKFSSQKAGCTRKQLEDICRRICDEKAVIFTDAFSAAEILGLMVDYVKHPDRDFLLRRDLLGPQNLPTRQPPGAVAAREVLAAVPAVDEHLRTTGVLPDEVSCTGGILYIAGYFMALANVIAGGKSGRDNALEKPVERPYPAIGDELVETTTHCIRGWVIHRPDLDLQWIQRDTRLLSWTFKPAWTREEVDDIG